MEKEKILILEDDDAQKAALQQFISAWGYEVISISTAAQAITYLSTNTPDMALIDLHLPREADAQVFADMLRRPGRPRRPVMVTIPRFEAPAELAVTWLGHASALVDPSGQVLVRWPEYERRAVDLDLLRTAHTQIAESCTKTTTYRTIRFPKRKG